jgi:hypothetical protein
VLIPLVRSFRERDGVTASMESPFTRRADHERRQLSESRPAPLRPEPFEFLTARLLMRWNAGNAGRAVPAIPVFSTIR